MSLVYEALQKAAREKNRLAGPPAPPPSQPVPAPVIVPAVRPRAPAIWITGISLAAFAAVLAGGVLFLRKPATVSALVTPPVPSAAPAPIVQPPVAPAPIGTAPVPDNSTGNDPRFKLTGIMKLGEEYSAVINGHVVARDQYVDGAIIKTVERDRVTLTVNGRELVLRLF